MNLISNAIKFTKSGHVYMNVSLEQEDDDKLYIRFDIEDTGIGIEKEKQAHIFGTFTQAESGTTRKFGGAGLGLAITKKLARLLGGTISLSSEVGKGSIFTIMIPVGVDTSGQDGLDRYDSVKHLQNTEQTEPVTKEEYDLCMRQFNSLPNLVRSLAEVGKLGNWVLFDKEEKVD